MLAPFIRAPRSQAVRVGQDSLSNFDHFKIEALQRRVIRAAIPPKSNRTNTIRCSKRLDRQRNCIERVIGHLKFNRAVATRYGQLADIWKREARNRREFGIK